MQNAPRGALCNTLAFIKLPFVIKIFVLFIFEWPFYKGFTVKFTNAIQQPCCVQLWNEHIQYMF